MDVIRRATVHTVNGGRVQFVMTVEQFEEFRELYTHRTTHGADGFESLGWWAN